MAALPSQFGFWVKWEKLQPTDALWKLAPPAARATWREQARIWARASYRAQILLGMDRTGQFMAALSPATLQAREDDVNPVTGSHPYSPMGRAKKAQPLTPCGAKSRILSLLRTTIREKGIYFWWDFDWHSGQNWGEVLARHRRGYRQQFVYPTPGFGYVPARDVFGLWPQGWLRLKIDLNRWWKDNGPKLVPRNPLFGEVPQDVQPREDVVVPGNRPARLVEAVRAAGRPTFAPKVRTVNLDQVTYRHPADRFVFGEAMRTGERINVGGVVRTTPRIPGFAPQR